MIKRVVSVIISIAVCAAVVCAAAISASAERGYYHTESGAIYGDINSDKSVDLLDLLLLRKHLAKWSVKIDDSAADVTGDGSVNLLDLLLLRKYLARWDVMLGKPNTSTEPSTEKPTNPPTDPPTTTADIWSATY